MLFPAKNLTREVQLHRMYSLRLLTYQLGSEHTNCTNTTFVNIKIWIFFVNRAPLTIVEFKCITFHSIYHFNMTACILLFLSRPTAPVLTVMFRHWDKTLLREEYLCLHFIEDQSCAPFHTSQRTTGKSTCMQGWSSFTIPCGIRFFWILFNLDFFRPFFVTTVSS